MGLVGRMGDGECWKWVLVTGMERNGMRGDWCSSQEWDGTRGMGWVMGMGWDEVIGAHHGDGMGDAECWKWVLVRGMEWEVMEADHGNGMRSDGCWSWGCDGR